MGGKKTEIKVSLSVVKSYRHTNSRRKKAKCTEFVFEMKEKKIEK